MILQLDLGASRTALKQRNSDNEKASEFLYREYLCSITTFRDYIFKDLYLRLLQNIQTFVI